MGPALPGTPLRACVTGMFPVATSVLEPRARSLLLPVEGALGLAVRSLSGVRTLRLSACSSAKWANAPGEARPHGAVCIHTALGTGNCPEPGRCRKRVCAEVLTSDISGSLLGTGESKASDPGAGCWGAGRSSLDPEQLLVFSGETMRCGLT